MKKLKSMVALAMSLFMLVPSSLFASSHREAPITALDRSADVTDWYAFVSYDNPNNVTFILNVDPLLEPANGPNYFPFDPNVLYEMHVDNNQDGLDDITFQFRFNTTINQPNLFTGFVGGIDGFPQITSLSGAGAAGLSLSQTYTVTEIKNGRVYCLSCGKTLYAVPSNVGPLTMPDYSSLFSQGIYNLGSGISVWAGTADDPFFIDLGAAFDSLNFRSGVGPVLSSAIDADNTHNYAPDAVSGYNVNSIVLEVPITMLTVDGQLHGSGDKHAVIGTYGSTSRHLFPVLRSGDFRHHAAASPADKAGLLRQVNREGNPLINELIIGTGSKDRFSMDYPQNDSQFSSFVLEPVLASVFSSLGVPVAPNPRTDLLLLVQYEAPICPGCGPNDLGPIADLLRLNTGIPPTPVGSQLRLGFIAGDAAGYPNGRRPIDDVFDISARAVAGILVDPVKYGTLLGDGVQTKTEGLQQFLPLRDAGKQWTQQRSHWTRTGRLHRTTRRYLPRDVGNPVAVVRTAATISSSISRRKRQAMKRIISTFWIVIMVATFAAAQRTTTGDVTDPSPAAQSISEARKAIADKPQQSAGYNLLATALVRRAQETSDVSFYAQAGDAIKKSLELAPNNFDAEKIQVSILLGQHEYPAALDAAKALNKKVPDDVMVYGLLTDANVELGNYNDAVIAAQWMLNLRPGNLPALIRAAHLRELTGDVEGSYELMDMAYQSTPPTEIAERAQILTQMGLLRLTTGSTDAAERFFQQALTSFPGYPSALGNLAQVHIAQKRYEDAVVLLQQRYQVAPSAGNLYDLAKALQLAGRDNEAKKAFAEFETKSLLESSKRQNSNYELVLYYVDHTREPYKALKVAREEYAWRHDVYTLDAYAWALHANGQDAEARKQIETALAVGIRDAELFRHAAEITTKLGDTAAAENYLKQSSN